MSYAYLAAGASVAGGLMGFAGNMKAGDAAKKVSEYNAAIQDRNAAVLDQEADRKILIGDIEAVGFRDDAGKLLDTMGVNYRNSGVVSTSDTPLLVMLAAANDMDEDIEKNKYNTKVQSLALREQGVGLRLGANVTREEGRQRKQAYRMKAYSSLLSGASGGFSAMGQA